MTVWLLLAAGALLAVPGSHPARRAAGLRRSGRLAAGSAVACGPAFPRIRVGRGRGGAVLVSGLGLAAGSVAYALPIGVAAAATSGSAWLLASGAAARRATSTAGAALLRSLRLLVAEFEAGASPAAALTAAATVDGPQASALAAAALAAGRGADPADALLTGPPALAAAGHALRLGERTGAPLATVLERVSADLAADADQQRAVAVALAGPRSSALLLALLPVVGIALGSAMGADPVGFLLTDHTGQWLCCAGALLDVAGVGWVAALLRRAQRS